jgi:cobalt-zinc-cadmium efflux system protein
MAHDHDHGLDTVRHEGPLRWALALTVGFLGVELAGAWLSNSLALLSDAAHMATDTFALAIALVAVRLARRPPDARRTYGYARAEALGALFNGSLLVLLAAWILFEAVQRFRQPPDVATTTMMLIEALGLVVNLAAMRLLKAGSGESLNMKGAYLEVWSDMLGSVAVLLGAVLIRFTGWTLIDPLLAVGIGLWVLPRTIRLLREAVHLLLEGVPRGLDVAQVRTAMLSVPGVDSVHDLHLWSVSSHQPLLSAHVAVTGDRPGETIREQVATLLEQRFGIHHSTLQIESAPCATPDCGVAGAHGQAKVPAHDHGHPHD